MKLGKLSQEKEKINMHRLKRINHDGEIETIYRHEDPETVKNYLGMVIINNPAFVNKVTHINFIDGCKGVQIEKENGSIYQYKLELRQ